MRKKIDQRDSETLLMCGCVVVVSLAIAITFIQLAKGL